MSGRELSEWKASSEATPLSAPAFEGYLLLFGAPHASSIMGFHFAAAVTLGVAWTRDIRRYFNASEPYVVG